PTLASMHGGDTEPVAPIPVEQVIDMPAEDAAILETGDCEEATIVVYSAPASDEADVTFQPVATAAEFRR
ncbi:MAG: hypothetical protein AAFV07_11975, partial [Bacteroidota bacterium]